MVEPSSSVRKKKTAPQHKKIKESSQAEGRARKKKSKHRGNEAGSRYRDPVSSVKNKRDVSSKDPRLGSKKPIPLLHAVPEVAIEGEVIQSTTSSGLVQHMQLEQQLEELENDLYLNQLLDYLEQDKLLSPLEQQYVDAQLDKIAELLEQLGITESDVNKKTKSD